MTQVVNCYCNFCKRVFHSFVYKPGDVMRVFDTCPRCLKKVEGKQWT